QPSSGGPGSRSTTDAPSSSHRGSQAMSGRPGAPRRHPGARTRRPAHRVTRRGLSRTGRVRSFGLLLLIAVAFLAIGIKLVMIQGVNSSHYLAAGASEWEQTITLPAQRGGILDRNGNDLAVSIPQTTIYADPHEVSDAPAEAAALGPTLRMSVST